MDGQQQEANNPANRRPSESNANTGSPTDGPQTQSQTPAPQQPRRPRPLRPNQFRMVALAAGTGQHGRPGDHHRATLLETGPQATLVGVPIEAHIEMASGVLQPAGRVTMVPPKRPNYPPARGDGGAAPPYAALHHHHHRFQPTTSLGATALTSSSSQKPNRYSWAQMQQWHASQSAAAAAAAVAHSDATGVVEGAPTGTTSTSGGFHYHLPTPFSSAASRVLYVPNPIVNLSEHTKSRLIKFIEAIKRFSEKWFSHVLLLLFLASYACFGAYIFISFEAPNEQWEKQLIIEMRSRIVNESYDQAHEASSREAYVEVARARFEEYERLLNRACQSGMTSNSLENQWTFWGALFYSMTVFTTIGYGHLTPVTFAGRVATMIYAIFGIPILLMVLADLGKLLTRIIKYAFKKFRYMYNKLLGRKASVRTRKLITDNTNQYIGQARHAFERGFATYIQPYQSRFPNSFLRDLRKGSPHNMTTVQPSEGAELARLTAQGDPGVQLSQEQSPQQMEPQLESSDVIITPAKHTRPVSPKIDDEEPKEPPLATSTQQEKQQEKQHGGGGGGGSGKQKDKLRRSRKISTVQKPAAELAARRASQKHSVQRSSSATNVDAKGAAAAISGSSKRASLDQQEPGAENDPNTTNSGSQHEKLNQADGSAYFAASEQGHHSSDLDALEQQQQQQHDAAEQEFLDELEEDLDIPVSFALFLLITYMMFGAVVFSIWESWNFFDSLYFVFISMSTIGFGDLVPQHPKRMIGTFAYLLFGLALTSMCINVVQEKIHATFLRAKMQIGEKMGFDLDQIMADDYYHGEGGSAYGDGESEAQLDENGSYANSLALSQTNSASAAVNEPSGGQQSQTSEHHQATSQQGATVAPLLASGELPAQLSRSKSKESLKWKKRPVSGAVGGGHSLSADHHSVGSSCRRKTSGGGGGGKKAPGSALQSQQSQSQPQARQQQQQHQHHQQQQQQQPQPQANLQQQQQGPAKDGTQQGGTQPHTSPIKHQVETIRMLSVPVMQQLEERARSVAPTGPSKQLNPSINQPIDGGVRAFCEPLRRAFQAGQRPRLVATRSQPSSPYPYSSSSNGSHYIISSQHGRQLPRAHDERERLNHSVTPTPRGGSQRGRLADLNSGRPWTRNGGRSGSALEHTTRSLASSRRGSVSDELNQLDDLIVALSKTPPERFGPLLGIPSPSRRSSRSNSPLYATLSGGSGAAPRRGTSLMVRGSSDSVAGGGGGREGRTIAGGRIPEKQRSFQSSATQTPPFLTPSSSNSLLAGHNGQMPDRRRKSSGSSSGVSRGYPMVSAQQSVNELRESQAALDELEAVRYSAV